MPICRLSLLLLTLFMVAAIGRTAPVSIRYSLDKPGQVSLAIYNEQGQLLRTLLTGEKQPAGEQMVSWDGLDRYGNPAVPGTYQWRLLRTDGFQAEYLAAIGTNTPVDPWHEWIGNHSPISAVLSDGKVLYLGALAENVPCHIAVPLDGGRILWSGGIRLAHGASRGMDFMNGMIFDMRTSHRGLCDVFAVDPATGERKYGFDVKHPQETKVTSDVRMSAGHGEVVVLYLDHQEMVWFNPAETVKENRVLSRVALPKPVDVAVDTAGTVYAISDGQIVTVTKDGLITTVIPIAQLTSPYRVAWVAATNELLVAEREGSHLVKRFALPTGKLLQSYGKAGGRADGPYDAQAFANLGDVADDTQGGFFIVEGGGGAMLRTAWFDGNGRLKQQWLGPQQFFNFAVADPDDPSQVWINGDNQSKTLCTVNFETGEWKVLAHYLHSTFGNLLPFASGAHNQWHLRRQHGQLYFYCDNGGKFGIVRLDEQAQKLLPVAAGGAISKEDIPPALLEALTIANLDPLDEKNLRYLWSDLNGDGSFQAEEFTVGRDLPLPNRGRKLYMDEQWNLYFHALPGDGQVSALKIPNVADAAAIAPQWDLAGLQKLPGEWPAEFTTNGSLGLRGGIWAGEDGSIFRQIGINENPRDDRPAPAWPTLARGGSRLVKWRADGSVEWSVGRQSHIAVNDFSQPYPAGMMHEPCAILGIFNDCVIVADRVKRPATAWTTDGLYAGDFFDRRADDGLPDRVYYWWRDPKTQVDGPVPYDALTGGSIHPFGKDAILWLPMGQQNSPAYRVTGWNGWDRQQGAVTIAETPAHASGTGSGLRAEYFKNSELAGAPGTVQIDRRLWFSQLSGGSVYRSWVQQVLADIIPTDAFSVRWTGQVEAPLSEVFTFMAINLHITNSTVNETWHGISGGMRVWLDGQLILEKWDPKAGTRDVSRPMSTPIRLEAGRRYDLRVEYANWGKDPAQFSLLWMSPTQELQRIPSRYLYPAAD